MPIFTLEQSKAAYRADFALYGAAVGLLAAALMWTYPKGAHWAAPLAVVAGLVSWSGIEYALHRFILHGLRPFQTWHEQHHDRPRALIGTPTLVSVAFFAVLIFLPAIALMPLWYAGAFTLGVLLGYLLYAAIHHAIHHAHQTYGWLARRKRWHAFHHGKDKGTCFGVTSQFWDQIFRSY